MGRLPAATSWAHRCRSGGRATVGRARDRRGTAIEDTLIEQFSYSSYATGVLADLELDTGAVSYDGSLVIGEVRFLTALDVTGGPLGPSSESLLHRTWEAAPASSWRPGRSPRSVG
ncbi:hypothetical protein LUR56_39205 [Streptomyces sp. MT29]|nr:hypothetical protein [Streptomyces sp. MT29]